MKTENTKYEAVIGLEVHLQLLTKSKVFCGCSTAFGQPPNTSTCPVCLGFPGSLPVLNRKAFDFGIKVALAPRCSIQEFIKFDRKNYYYPDLPKNYQISQFDKPLAYDGYVEIDNENKNRVAIRRVHLEEDAGKLLHDQDRVSSVVDYNRAGTPLLEIVTEPDMHTPEEAYAYLTNLKETLLYLEVSDCNMEEGSLRCDANISVRMKGEKKLGVKSELKNMNSFKAVRAGLEYEIERHIDLLENGQRIVQETRLWDEGEAVTRAMRTKEESHDYKYFPEPDLVPFVIDKEAIKRIRESLPELPRKRKARFLVDYGLSDKEAVIVIADKNIADYFEEAVRYSGKAKVVYNWLTGDIMSELNKTNSKISDYGCRPLYLSELIALIDNNTISGKMAKEILRESGEKKKSPLEIVEARGLRQISDQSELEAIAQKVINENEKSVGDYRSGKKNALMFLVGQVMRHTKGKANPAMVNDVLKKKMES